MTATLLRLTASEALEAFRGWIKLALPTLTDVVIAKSLIPDVPRLEPPYATVERTGQRPLASPYRRVGDELAVPEGDADDQTHELELTQVREITVQLRGYGATTPDLFETLELVHGEIASQTYLETQGIAVREISDVLATRELRDTVHEPAAALDFAVVYTLEALSSVGTIESVDTMGFTDIPTV
jgi:hypothetical protein